MGVNSSVLQAEWKSIATECAQKIHAINPNVIIMVSSIPSDQLQPNFKIDAINEPNIVYDLHLYYHYEQWTDWYKSYQAGNLSLAKNQLETYLQNYCFDPSKPIFFGEIGADSADPFWQQQIVDMYSLLAKYNIGWCQFAWYPDPNFSLIGNDWTTLSAQGQLWERTIAPISS